MSVPNEGAGASTHKVSEGEASGKHSILTTLKSSVIWLAVILGLLAVISWGAVEFGFLPQAPAE